MENAEREVARGLDRITILDAEHQRHNERMRNERQQVYQDMERAAHRMVIAYQEQKERLAAANGEIAQLRALLRHQPRFGPDPTTALFQFLILQHSGAAFYCLSVDGGDPPAATCAALTTMGTWLGQLVQPEILPASAALASASSGVTLRDGRPGRGIILNITGPLQEGENEAWVTGGYYEHGLSSESSKYHIVRTDLGWAVEGAQQLWVA